MRSIRIKRSCVRLKLGAMMQFLTAEICDGEDVQRLWFSQHRSRMWKEELARMMEIRRKVIRLSEEQ
jgi:hypothetical protein